MKLLSLFLFLLSLDVSAGIFDRSLPLGKRGQIVSREGYSLQYNTDCKVPHWVSYKITADDLNGSLPRTNDFRADPEIQGSQAQLEDYRRSGYNRGHMARAGLFTKTRKLKSESFILTNMVPQDPYMNQNGAWRKLEDFEESSIKKFGELHIVSGPVIDQKVQRIGPNEVCVPQYVYKVLFRGGANPQAIAFVIPNFRTSDVFTVYAVSVDELEKLTGIDFLPELENANEARVEASFDLKAW